MMEFLCGVEVTLLLESVALMIATAWMRRKIDERNNVV